MDIVSFVLTDFLHGLVASLQGFLVIHKLDGDRKLVDSGKQISEREKKPKTVLQRRREANDASRKRSNSGILPPDKPTALKRIMQCVVVNVACVLLLQLLLIPIIRLFWLLVPFNLPNGWSVDIISRTFGAASIFPVFLITRAINALWFSDIANASLRFRKVKQKPPLSFSHAIADFAVAVLVETIFLLQSLLCYQLSIPVVASFLAFFHLTLLNALYSFEYLWMSVGRGLRDRLARIERRWPYYVGFGTPLTLITTSCDSFVMNGCLFGMFFPVFIISSYLADEKVSNELVSVLPTIKIFRPSLFLSSRITLYMSQYFFSSNPNRSSRTSSVAPSSNRESFDLRERRHYSLDSHRSRDDSMSLKRNIGND
ncbi:hypothetical protein AB6A40_002862 [Gnathostoma spinigerum]|uniref:Etoposide-induced protein 2.4 n=1 Tax=Gnathostoma spinigerum TaxID=75299 RepID=A0ABD6EGS6_9BILA